MDRNETRLPATVISCPVATMDEGHGQVGKVGGTDTPFNPFTRMLGPRATSYDLVKLGALAKGMVTAPDALSDGPDPEENLYMPAGYTYFGQFIDHDLTLDTTSTLNPEDLKNPEKPLNDPTNVRSPRFDLDSVYGNGPGDQPYMYATADDATAGLFAGASLLVDTHDLARASNGRAIIGDKRNDENSIVNQIQQTFIGFHNKVVSDLATDRTLRGGALFKAARDQVRWAYQRIIIDDFLPRIVDPSVLDAFQQNPVYALYADGPLRWNLPREFVAAAYRFGHSGVRSGYRLNGADGADNGTILPIFTNVPTAPNESLIGFDPLPPSHVVDHWGRFFPSDTPRAGERTMSNGGTTNEISDKGTGGNGAVRLQYAYKIDPSLVDPLANLPPKVASKDDIPVSERGFPDSPGPSLSFLNLLRGNRYQLQGGQAYANALKTAPLDRKYLCVRVVNDPPGGPRTFTFKPISELVGRDGSKIGSDLDDDTPLWFYILAEAQKPIVDFWLEHVASDGKSLDLTEDQMLGRDALGSDFLPFPQDTDPKSIPPIVAQQLRDSRCAGTRLGAVGGRIVIEVFYGLMESDGESVLRKHRADGWLPIWNGPATMTNLLRYVDPATAP
ncbi:MAG: peroxidase family protein [Burkholderiaceae bacterium]